MNDSMSNTFLTATYRHLLV